MKEAPVRQGSHLTFLGLGSNMGDRERNIYRAVKLLRDEGVQLLRASSLYETRPFGFTEQPDFLNAVIKAATDLPPDALLRKIKNVERSLGRRAGRRWGPRPIDIDILLFDESSLSMDDLKIPHSGIRERAFVLVPLQEIAPEVNIEDGLSAKKALDRIDAEGIRRYGPWRYGDE